MDNMLSVCVYCDSTDLYTEEEIMSENLTDLLFPEHIVRAWYETHKQELDDETMHELHVSKDECSFELWYRDVSTAMDTDGLYDFAKQMGFTATRGEGGVTP